METSLRRHLFDDHRTERAPTRGFDVRAIQVRDVRALPREPFQTDRSGRPIVTRLVAFGIRYESEDEPGHEHRVELGRRRHVLRHVVVDPEVFPGMRNERLAPGLDGEVHQRIHDAAFGATQSQSRGVFRHVARKAAVFEFAPTAAWTWIVTPGSVGRHRSPFYRSHRRSAAGSLSLSPNRRSALELGTRKTSSLSAISRSSMLRHSVYTE